MDDATLFDPADPREWLRRARSNAAVASSRLPGVDPGDLCFNAQQAAEKAVKAVLLARDANVPRTHRIDELLRLAAEAGCAVPDAVLAAAHLSEYAVRARYPGAVLPASAVASALDAMRAVLAWAEPFVGADGVRERRPRDYGAPPVPRRGVPPVDAATLRAIVARVVAAARPERIILFGSAARGDAKRDSDFDLLVVKSGDYAQGDVVGAIHGALRDVAQPVDVVLVTPEWLERYGNAPGLVYRPALAEGIVVYDAADGVAAS
jgi:uncharacterized protein